MPGAYLSITIVLLLFLVTSVAGVIWSRPTEHYPHDNLSVRRGNTFTHGKNTALIIKTHTGLLIITFSNYILKCVVHAIMFSCI